MTAFERLGLALATFSFMGTFIICGLPNRRVPKLSNDSSINDSQVLSGGLWKFCVTSSMNLTQCEMYEKTQVSVTQDREVAKPFIIIVIIAGVFGILTGVAGTRFINFVPDRREKSKMAMAAGLVFLTAGIFVLIAISLTTISIKGNFDSPLLPPDSPKRELGASIHIGWFTAGFLFLGGGLLCSSFLHSEKTD